MDIHKLQFRWPHFVLCALTTLVVLGLLSTPSLWRFAIGPLFSETPAEYPFRDMNARLGMAEGIAHGIDINHEINPYTDFYGLNNKPLYTVHTMALLGLDRTDRASLGLFFGCCYLTWSFWLLRPKNAIEALGMLAILLSPPSLLLIERANDDIIIFTSILSVPLLLHSRKKLCKQFGWALICLITPMKYYPAAAYALFLRNYRNSKEFMSYCAASGTFIAILLWLIKEEFSNISSRIPSPNPSFAFGGKLLFQSLKLEAEQQSILYAIGIALILLLAGLILWHKKIQLPKTPKINELYFLLGSAILSFCFALNSNWDYRLAFLIPTLPLTYNLMRSTQFKMQLVGFSYTLSILLTAWPEYLFFWNAIDVDSGGWLFTKENYQKILILKQAASWFMIAGNALISVLILKPDCQRLCMETFQLLKQKMTIRPVEPSN